MGFKNVKIIDFEDLLTCKENILNVELQFFNANLIGTWQHLFFAALNALTAFKNKKNISKSIAMETMLYASTTHQIQKALKLGIKRDLSTIAILIISSQKDPIKSALQVVSQYINGDPDDAVLNLSKDKEQLIQKFFRISDLEIETVMKNKDFGATLTKLIIERMALLLMRR